MERDAGRKRLFLKVMKPAIVTGLLLLFVGNGVVIWVEQFLPSAMVAIMISSSPSGLYCWTNRNGLKTWAISPRSQVCSSVCGEWFC